MRGIANTGTQLALRNFCAKQKLDLLFILEPMVEVSTLPVRFWRLCGLNFMIANDMGNSIPNLWLCCEEGIYIKVISCIVQQITVEATFNLKMCRIIWVYVSTRYVRRRRLYVDILHIYNQAIAWCFVGDFTICYVLMKKVVGVHQISF